MAVPLAGPILAFDCSGSSCSASIQHHGTVLAHRFAAMERGQASALLPQIDSVMREAGIGFDALSMIATTVGPGSFTGLRIGLAAARGFALCLGCPIASVTGFEALFEEVADGGPPRPVAILIDSRRGTVFAQWLGSSGAANAAPVSLEPADIEAWLPSGAMILAGDTDLVSVSRTDCDLRPLRIDARAVARAALRRAAASLARPAQPLYLRPPDVSLPKLAAGR